MRKLILICVLSALFLTSSAFAQLPPAKWWRRAEIVNAIGLSEEQQMKLDTIFRGAANDLIDVRAEIEKQNVALRGELDQPQLNRSNIQKISSRLNEAMGRRFDRELSMLIDMRGVLTDQQWNRMRAQLDQIAATPRGDRREMAPKRQMQRH